MKHNTIYRYALVLVMMMSTLMGMAQNQKAYLDPCVGRFVNVGYVPTKNTKLVLKMSNWYSDKRRNGIIFGSKKSSQNFYVHLNDKTFTGYFGDKNVVINVSSDDAGKLQYSSNCFYLTLSKEELSIDFGYQKKKHNYSAVFTDSFDSFTAGNPIVIGGCNINSTVETIAEEDIDFYLFEAWIYEGDELVHHYLPSYNESKTKLYDTVTGTYCNTYSGSSSSQSNMGYDVYANQCQHRYTHREGNGSNLKFICNLCNTETKVSSVKKAQDNEITVTNPAFDIQADEAGVQTMTIAAPNKMTSYCILDSATNEVVVWEDCRPEAKTSASVTLEHHEAPRTLAVYINTVSVDYGVNPADSTYQWVKQYIRYLPMHTIAKVEVTELQNIDVKTGLRNPANLVSFAIDDILPLPVDKVLEQNKLTATKASVEGFDKEGFANIFDKDKANKWCGKMPSKEPVWVEFEAKEPITVSNYYICTGNDILVDSKNRNPKSWKLYARNSESGQWKLVSTVKDGQLPKSNSTLSQPYTVYGAVNERYQYFKFEFSSVENGNIFEIGEIYIGSEIIKPADQQDIISDDLFIIERSYSPKFTNAETVGTCRIKDVSEIETVTKDGKKVQRGWISLIDNDREALVNTKENEDKNVFLGDEDLLKSNELTASEKDILRDFFTYPERHVYYRVYRTMAYELWRDCGEYVRDTISNSACLLPGITTISVHKDKNWSENKKVSLKVRLDNPYPWEFNQLLDSAKVHKIFNNSIQEYGRRYIWDKNAKITIKRFCPDEEHAKDGKDYASKTITIDGKKVEWVDSLGAYYATVEDVQSLPYLHYYYSAVVNQNSTTFPVAYNEVKLTTREEADACYSQYSMLVYDLKVSKGNVRGCVELEWNQGDLELDSVTVMRRVYGNEDAKWERIFRTTETVTTYQDKSALIGNVYEYQVIGRMTIKYTKNEICENTLEDWGYMPYYGKMAGHVMMSNGTSMAGVKLRITRDEPIHIDDVFDRYGSIMMQGVHEGVDAHARPLGIDNSAAQDTTVTIIDKDKEFLYQRYVTTDEEGKWEADSLIFTSGGSKYVVEVMEYPGEFEYMGVVQAPQITLSKTQYENTDVRLMYISTKRVSGYAYYRNSTIPVPNANFYLDGVMLYNSNGEPLRTQPDGKFTLTVSSMKKINKLEIRKDGHKFTDDGVMISDKVVKTDLDGFIMYDDTKVRLAGRVVGGHVEADKPLGFGLSKNNLGDDIKLVLQLEGDNSASIVYFPNDPNRTSVVETVNHEIYNVTNEVRDTSVVGSTTVTSERKRIVIDVDNKTGEYMADLYPAKYKVVQMYCKGYSTLYRANEGFAVIDLSDCKPGIDMEDIRTDSIRGVSWSTWYDATFNRTYHNPVKVSYVQYEKGKAVDYYGESEVDESNPFDGTVKSSIVSYKKVGTADAPKDSLIYTFKYPVFQSGKRYVFQTSTYEDYVYNNENGNAIDIVPVSGDTLIVRNNVGSNNDVVTVVNDENGQARVIINADNPTFFDRGTQALRSINFMVKSNGYYYEGNTLYGFVLGKRKLGTDVVGLGESIKVFDVLRDPLGSKSYSYRDAGTTYTWSYDKNSTKVDYFNGSIEVGATIFSGVGLGMMVGSETTIKAISGTLNKPLKKTSTIKKTEYTMTLEERVSTSDDPLDQGAMSDVYIGAIEQWGMEQSQVVTVINQRIFDLARPAINAGCIGIIGKGYSADGSAYYLVIHDKYDFGKVGLSSFAYSQKHIVGTIIPSLKQELNSLLTDISTPEEEKKLREANESYYWRSLENRDKIIWNKQDNPPAGQTNVAESLATMINAWKTVVTGNDNLKLEKMSANNPVRNHSIADAMLEHKETASSYYMDTEWVQDSDLGQSWSLGAGISSKPSTSLYDKGDSGSGSKGDSDIDIDEALKGIGALLPEDDHQYGGGGVGGLFGDDDNNSDKNDIIINLSKGLNVTPHAPDDINPTSNSFKGFGVYFSVGVGGGNSTSGSTDKSMYKVNSGGFGYVLGTNDNSYFSVDVFNVTPRDQYIVRADNDVNDNISSGKSEIVDSTLIHNYIFIPRGGAARNPWVAPDSTTFMVPKQALGAPMMKIDNPKIYVDKPIVNNITKDENAVFSIRLTNETELANGDRSHLHPSVFHLKVDDRSNPYGAKIYMDGQPISSGRDFTIPPGESITKTIEVERGSKEYNYDDLRLVFSDEIYSLNDDAKISVHYLPTSTPLRLSVPTDKWVMNTFSQMDEEGKYYIPVEITDYSLTYDNFDHIDLQYKKATEGESQWVTLCSYYADEDLYNKASGKKGKIDSGSKINNIKFYGGANIEEQEYNLRAVSYCRMGNDFVTRASDVISGIKDTRRPEIFGVPSPKDGILSFDEVIQFPFTERIAYNHLNATSNFTVQGYTNEMMGTFSNPLFFNGDASTIVSSEVERSLANRDFTIDLMVKMEQDRFNTPLFAVGNVTNYASFWTADVTDKEDSDRYFRFALYTPERIYASPRIKTDLKASLTRVGVIVDNQAKKVQFLVDKNIYDCDGKSMLELADQEDTIYVGNTVYGPVYVGFDPSYDIAHHKGEITEVRLWNKALNTIEVNQTYNKRLSGYNRDLIGYWPMNEAVGDYAYDEVNGATLNLQGASWESDKGVALVADSVEVRLKADAIAGAMNEDYTMRFWFRTRPFESKAGKAYIFRAGNDELAKGKGRMYLAYENGQLVLNSMDENRIIGSQDDYADGKWHNFTLVVSRSRNTFATYLDKELKLQGGADEMDHPDNGYISLGDSTLYMNFDEMSVWAKALPDYYIDKFYNSRLHGTESDMIVYLPFEEETLDSHNLPVRTFSAKNQKLSERVVQYPDGTSENTGEMVADGTVLILDNEEKGYGENLGYDVLRYEVSCAPLKNSPELRNLPFSWSSTGTALQININQNDADINKQNIYVTVRDIEDEQGNTLKSPHMWTYFVDKNVLRWNTQAVNITVPYGETTEKKVMWKNVSGRSSNYSIVNKASWLSLSNDFKMTNPATTLIGYANAEEENEVTLHIGDGISPGFYSETIYLTDENGLSEPLHVNLTVEALKPLWDVDPAKYEYNMNMKAVVMVKGREDNVIDTDTRDIVGAFVGLECVGKGNIITKDNNSYVYMTIYGNKTMQEKKSKVRFRLWSASTGLISEMDRSTDINGRMTKETLIFNNGSFVGIPPSNPDELTVNNITEQQIEVQPGWNWIAFNVMPKPTSKTDSLFSHFSGFTEGDIIKRVDYSTYSEGTYNWYGTLCNLDYAHTYQVFAKNGGRLGIRGTNPEEFLKDVSVLGNKWFDLPYHLKVVQPLSVALADFRIGEKANIGDIIKSYNSFAVATENGWEGTLQYMRPGEGYYIYHSGENTSFRYPENANNSTQTTAYAKKLNPAIKVEALSETSMPVIAVLDEEVGIEKGDVLQAYCNGELISEANVLEVGEDKEKLFFLSLNANDGSVIEFTVKRGEEEIKAVTKVKYNSSVVVGSLDYPCVIRFSENHSRGEGHGDIYDLGGRKLQESDLLHNGIYIINNEKVVNK